MDTLPPIRARYAINVVQDGHGRILLLKRSAAASLGPGLWGFPAGHIEDGETPRGCADRELEEETGAVDVPVIRSVGPVRDRGYGGVFEVHLFHRHWLGGTPRLNAEHTDHAWVGPEDYPRYTVMTGIDEDLAHLGIWSRQPPSDHA